MAVLRLSSSPVRSGTDCFGHPLPNNKKAIAFGTTQVQLSFVRRSQRLDKK